MQFRCFARAVVGTALAVSLWAATADGALADRIRYDSHCFTLNGQDTLIYSGSFHYFRCPKPLWAARLQSMKSAGLNTVETYVPWNWHERTPPAGVDDFSKIDLTDLHDFLELAIHQFGFNVMIRPGPYICAEWDGGGYPQWLRLQKPAGYQGMWYRSDDPTYLAWCKHWFKAVADVAAPYQITRQPAGKPGIFLWQIENEYDYDSHPPEVKLHQLQALAHDSRDDGIEVPLFTCMTDNRLFRQDPYLLANVIDTKNAYPGFDAKGFVAGIDQLRPYQPEKPLAMSELQGGWFANVGGQLSQAKGYNAAQITQLTLLAWAHGFTSTNYYMMFGGTNFGDWAAAGLTTTYDYAAPIREPGGVDERYQAVSGMAQMIQQIGPKLVRSEYEPFSYATAQDISIVMRKAEDGTRFVFVFNNSVTRPAKGSMTLGPRDLVANPLEIALDLKPFDAKVLVLPPGGLDYGKDESTLKKLIAPDPPKIDPEGEYVQKGEWLPNMLPLPARPNVLPEAIVVKMIKHKADGGPVAWTPVTGDASEESAGVFDRRFVFYRATLPDNYPHPDPALLCRTEIDGVVTASLNGTPIMSQDGRGGLTFPVPNAGSGRQFVALYNNAGRPNGGAKMEAPGGIVAMSMTDANSISKSIGTWHFKHLARGDRGLADVKVDADETGWDTIEPKAAAELIEHQSAVYRCTVDITPAQLAAGRTELNIGRIDDRGTIYVNGQRAGESTSWDTPVQLEIGKYLHAGSNVIAVIVHNLQGTGGLGFGISLDRPTTHGNREGSLPYEIGTQCTGDAEQWFAEKFDDSSWTAADSLTENHPTPAGPVIDWYRLHVALPEAPAHAWVPLKLRLDAVGDGFLYLNGHPLGRWWHQGPQRDFFLPDCWLNRGADNVVTMSLQNANGVGVKSASVLPYEDLSEVRP